MTAEVKTHSVEVDPTIVGAVDDFGERLIANLGEHDQVVLLEGFTDARKVIDGGREAMAGLAGFVETDRLADQTPDYKVGYKLAFMIENALNRSAT